MMGLMRLLESAHPIKLESEILSVLEQTLVVRWLGCFDPVCARGL